MLRRAAAKLGARAGQLQQQRFLNVHEYQVGALERVQRGWQRRLLSKPWPYRALQGLPGCMPAL